jgi:hypothetical protein
VLSRAPAYSPRLIVRYTKKQIFEIESVFRASFDPFFRIFICPSWSLDRALLSLNFWDVEFEDHTAKTDAGSSNAEA